MIDFNEILDRIENAEINWTVADLKGCIFADDLRECELIEAIGTGVFHNYSLIKDALVRTGSTIADLRAAADKLAAQWPESYAGEDAEWAIWDCADHYVMEVLGRDSRICKRAGWELL